MSVFFSPWAVCMLSPASTSDLHAVHSGRRQLVVARCHAKLWPLSVQSHRRAGQGKVKRTVTSEPQSSNVISCCKYSKSQEIAGQRGIRVAPFWVLFNCFADMKRVVSPSSHASVSFLSTPSARLTRPPSWARGHFRA